MIYRKLAAGVALPAPELEAKPTIDVESARKLIHSAVTESFVRPSDIGRASIDEPVLLKVPFWWIDAAVEGFHIGLGSRSVNGRSRLVPTGGANRRSDTVMVCARREIPYSPSLHSFLDGLKSHLPMSVELHDLQPTAPIEGSEIVDADVTQAQAERIATDLLMNRTGSNGALYAKYDRYITHTAYLSYPLWFAAYQYEGEARRARGESFFVLACARTGRVVAAKHPSALRAVTAKLRRVLSFQRP